MRRSCPTGPEVRVPRWPCREAAKQPRGKAAWGCPCPHTQWRSQPATSRNRRPREKRHLRESQRPTLQPACGPARGPAFPAEPPDITERSQPSLAPCPPSAPTLSDSTLHGCPMPLNLGATCDSAIATGKEKRKTKSCKADGTSLIPVSVRSNDLHYFLLSDVGLQV